MQSYPHSQKPKKQHIKRHKSQGAPIWLAPLSLHLTVQRHLNRLTFGADLDKKASHSRMLIRAQRTSKELITICKSSTHTYDVQSRRSPPVCLHKDSLPNYNRTEDLIHYAIRLIFQTSCTSIQHTVYKNSSPAPKHETSGSEARGVTCGSSPDLSGD